MTPLDTRVPPIPAGTLCRLGSLVVRAYARIWPGELWDGRYRIHHALLGWMPMATRDQLEVLHG